MRERFCGAYVREISLNHGWKCSPWARAISLFSNGTLSSSRRTEILRAGEEKLYKTSLSEDLTSVEDMVSMVSGRSRWLAVCSEDLKKN